MTSGVPQGSVLGPTLFLIYINDLVNCIEHSQITLFADDLKMFNLSQNSVLLQSDLDNLYSWASTWQLSVSVSKSNVMYLGKNNPKLPYYLNGNLLENVGSSCKDLGVFISNDLSSSVHCNSIVGKASRISGLILRTFLSRDPKLLIRAFKTYVRPILEYATVIWNPHLIRDTNAIENIQRRFTKRISNPNFTYDQRLKLFNLDRLELRRIHFDAIMAFNIIKRQLLPFDEFYSFPTFTKTRSGELQLLSIEKFRLDLKKFSFSIRSSRIWNAIPSDIKALPNVTLFKRCLSKVDLSNFLIGRV